MNTPVVRWLSSTSPRGNRDSQRAPNSGQAGRIASLVEQAEMVTRHRERRRAAPSVGGRVVNFMRGNNILIGVTAADGVNFEPDDFFC
jgi:hypothetical protein